MNQRIKELASQAEMSANCGDCVDVKIMMEKFAELIINECLLACSRANEIRHFVPPTQEQVVLSCIVNLKQHFGVEE